MPRVTARKSGARPGGSMVTRMVTKALNRLSKLGIADPSRRDGPLRHDSGRAKAGRWEPSEMPIPETPAMLGGSVATGLQAIAVGIDDEGSVIVLAIVGAQARRAIVAAACTQGGGMEGDDTLP